MMLVEPVPDNAAHHHHKYRDHPVVLGRECQRIVVRQHQENHGQGKVVVVQTTLLGLPALDGRRRFPLYQHGHSPPLIWNDAMGDICGHDCCGDCAKMDERAATRIDQRQRPADDGEENEDDD